MSESPQRWLSDLYRASSREEPPASLDRAILAEARKASRFPTWIATGWGAPLAAAAVVVMTVSLVIALRDDPAYFGSTMPPEKQEPSASRSDKQILPDVFASKTAEPGKPPNRDQPYFHLSAPKQQAQGDVKREDRIAKAEREIPGPTISEEQESPALASKAELMASAAPVQATPAPPLEAREQPPAQPASAPPAVAGALGKLGAPSEDISEQRRARASAERDQASPQAKQAIAGNEVPRRLESAIDDRIAPEVWLERIVKLRDEGRHAEARESLAAFKKRYPDHPLPDALKSY